MSLCHFKPLPDVRGSLLQQPEETNADPSVAGGLILSSGVRRLH